MSDIKKFLAENEEKELLRLQNEAATAETKPERKGLDDSALDLVGFDALVIGFFLDIIYNINIFIYLTLTFKDKVLIFK